MASTDLFSTPTHTISKASPAAEVIHPTSDTTPLDSEFEFGGPSTIPETQPEPAMNAATQRLMFQSPEPTTPPAKVHSSVLATLRSPIRNRVSLIWKPTGHTFCVDFHYLTFDSFLEAVKEVQEKLGPVPAGDQYVNKQGVHYSIGGSNECILTMAEEYKVFVERVAGTRNLNTTMVTIRPVDIIVSRLHST